MPELPEVETMARDLREKIPGLTVEQVRVFDARVLKDMTAAHFTRRMKGVTFGAVRRRGKGIIIELDNGRFLFVQVKMTGYFVYGPQLRVNQESSETKVVFRLSNGQYLNYNDQRLFGWLYYVDRLDEVPYLTTIGPEPLESDFTLDDFFERIGRRVSPIKTLLMDQHFIAGIGNIYASEILYASRIHPQRRANTLNQKQISRLHRSIVKILNEAVESRGTSMRNYRDSSGQKGNFMRRIKVYGRKDRQCPSCKQPIQRIVQAQRSTFFCNHCQE